MTQAGTRNFKKLSLFISGISCCLLLLSGCEENRDNSYTDRRSSNTTHRVEVATITVESLSIIKKVSGNLEAVTRQRIYNEESARISRLPFFAGDKVKRGDILVQLDDALIRTEVAKALASYRQAEADLTRLKKLMPKNIATEEEVALARTALDLAKADVDYQRTRLNRTTLKADSDGVVTERLFEPGDLIPAQSHILTIIDPSRLRVKVYLGERLLPLVQPEQAVTLRIDALGSQDFTAKVSRIYPTVDSNTHKGTIEIELNPVPENALAGQFVQVTFQLKLDAQLVLPTRSIQLEPAGAYVYRITESDRKPEKPDVKVEKIYFEKGPQFADKTVVKEGLSPGDRIVTRGFLGLRHDKTVEIARQYLPAQAQQTTATPPSKVN